MRSPLAPPPKPAVTVKLQRGHRRRGGSRLGDRADTERLDAPSVEAEPGDGACRRPAANDLRAGIEPRPEGRLGLIDNRSGDQADRLDQLAGTRLAERLVGAGRPPGETDASVPPCGPPPCAGGATSRAGAATGWPCRSGRPSRSGSSTPCPSPFAGSLCRRWPMLRCTPGWHDARHATAGRETSGWTPPLPPPAMTPSGMQDRCHATAAAGAGRARASG